MKKIWAFVLSAVLLSLPGCGKSTDSSAATEEPVPVPSETVTAQAESEIPNITEMPSTDGLYSVLPSRFTFSSGTGGWMTVMELNDDGSFTGSFQDSDMGVRGEGYPKGTVYKSDFSGKFSRPEQLG